MNRPQTRVSDLWRAPLHDFPIRDEIVYQYLPLCPEMRVLEVGPGNGITAFRLCRQVSHVTVLDVAPGNLRRLRNTLASLKNVDCICADTCEPGFERQVDRPKFDAILGLEVFEYVRRPDIFLTNMASVLKPGGTLALQWPNYPPARTGGVTWVQTVLDLEKDLSAAGFRTWSLYRLSLNRYADWIFRTCHEQPLRAYRRLRVRPVNNRPQTYDDVWAFNEGASLRNLRVFVHAAWSVLAACMHLGGECFQRVEVKDDDLQHNLLLLARK